MKIFAIILGILFLHSCAMKSGRYVQKNGRWVFQPEQTGFMRFIENPGADGSMYDYADTGRFLWPVPASKRISSFYGPRSGRHHDGIDIPARRGAHILAADRGKVVFAGKMRGYGNVVVIKHEGGYHSVYAHNQNHHVKKGQKVSRGEVIAQVGSTGRSSGPHVHFEIRKNNKARNPSSYLNKAKKIQVASGR